MINSIWIILWLATGPIAQGRSVLPAVMSEGYLRFADQRTFDQTVAMLQKLSPAARASWEKRLGFRSMRDEFERTLMAEEQYFGVSRSRAEVSARISSSDGGPVAFNPRAVLVVVSRDGARHFELNASSEAIASVLNADGLVQIGSDVFVYSRSGRLPRALIAAARYIKVVEEGEPGGGGAASSGPAYEIKKISVPPNGTWNEANTVISGDCKIILYVNFDQIESENTTTTSFRLRVRSLRRTVFGWDKNDKANINLRGYYAANRFPTPANSAWNVTSAGKTHTLDYPVFLDIVDKTISVPILLFQGNVRATRNGCAHGVISEIKWQ